MRVQNLTDGRLPTWRHGRTWIGKFSIEWKTPTSSFGVSVKRLGFSLRIGLFALYVSHRRSDDYFPRQFEIRWGDGCLWISHPWERQMEWCSADPWWKKVIVLHVVDWLIGKQRYDQTKGQPFEVYIPMPEGCYRAQATPETIIWKRRWYWPEKRRDSVWLSIPGGGIPHSGKGENSWDCGDDGLCGTGGETVEDAIANAVRSSLKSRRKYGHDSRRTGARPAVALNSKVARG